MFIIFDQISSKSMISSLKQVCFILFMLRFLVIIVYVLYLIASVDELPRGSHFRFRQIVYRIKVPLLMEIWLSTFMAPTQSPTFLMMFNKIGDATLSYADC